MKYGSSPRSTITASSEKGTLEIIKKTAVIAGLAAMTLSAPRYVFADTNISAPEPQKLELASLSIENLLDVKVSTASKKVESISESPAAVYVIDSTDIYRYGYRTLADALGSVVGLYMSSDRGFDYLGVRGYSHFGDYNGRILVLIDGHRVNDPIFDTGTIGEELPVDIEDIDRIEVVKGPGSSLWGTNALLATVNVITKTGHSTDGAKLAVSGDKYHAEYGKTSGSGLDIVVSATGMHSDGQSSIYFPEFNAPETDNGIAENVDGIQSTHTRVAVSNRGMRFSYAHGARTKVLPTAAYGTIFGDPGETSADDRRQIELSYETPQSASDSRSLLARVFSDQYIYVGNYPYDYPPRTIYRDDYVARWWGAEMRLTNTLSDALSVTYGAEYLRAGKIVQRSYDVDPYYEYGSTVSTQTTRSLFAQASYRPNDLMHFIVGTRCDRFSSFGSTWSPRAAFVYSPTKDTSIKLLYGNAFRAPNTYELSWVDPDLPTTQPEKIRNYELVWEQRLSLNSRLVASLFNSQVTDIITLEGSSETWYITNQGHFRTKGFELQYETRAKDDIRGYAGLSMTRTCSSEGRIANSPNYVLTCGLSVPILGNKYFVSPYMSSRGRVFTESGGTISPQTQANLTITSAPRSSGTSISLGVYNILGTTLYVPGPTDMALDKIPQPARSMRLTVSRVF